MTVVEFADFQCPFCRGHSAETLPQLREIYGDRVRYVFRDFPLTQIHPRAFQAAEAAQCAFAQGAFWRYHGLLFENQDALALTDLTQYAASVGLDMVAFESCVESGAYKDEVQADYDAGVEYGVNGTPAFFVNGPRDRRRRVLQRVTADHRGRTGEARFRRRLIEFVRDIGVRNSVGNA